MKNLLNSGILSIQLISATMLFTGCDPSRQEIRTFYEADLNSPYNPGIAWGSRVKPFFSDAVKKEAINECWVNREGTLLAVVWNEGLSAEEKEAIIAPVFSAHFIEARLITDRERKLRASDSFFSNVAPSHKGKDKWYEGLQVDNLSLEEAGSIGDSATTFALKAGLINDQESVEIKRDIIEYMKTELVIERRYKELISDETDVRWKKQGYETYTKYVGAERAAKIRDYYIDYQKWLKKR